MDHAPLRRYIRRPDRPVAAVRIALETEGFRYRKWGAEQRAKAGDWLVDNDGDVYTVAHDVFERTYRAAGRGAYVKTTSVYAVPAEKAGSIRTAEGAAHYQAGDYLVSHSADGSDRYAVTRQKFESLFEPDLTDEIGPGDSGGSVDHSG